MPLSAPSVYACVIKKSFDSRVILKFYDRYFCHHRARVFGFSFYRLLLLRMRAIMIRTSEKISLAFVFLSRCLILSLDCSWKLFHHQMRAVVKR
jgi:hypothetical protein